MPKIHGADLYNVKLGKEYTEFPENPGEGELAYVNNELYIYTVTQTDSFWAKVSADHIYELSDVVINELVDKQILRYNGTTGKWTNIDLFEDYVHKSGDIITGDIIPSTANTISLGSETFPFYAVHAEHGYFGANSIYINGKKVISDESDQIYISTDPNQDLILKTVEGGDLRFESDNNLNMDGDGSITTTITGNLASKHIDMVNNSSGGDIGITSIGTNGAVQLFAQKEVDIQASNIFLVGNGYLNGEQILTSSSGSGVTSGWALMNSYTYSNNTIYQSVVIPSGIDYLYVVSNIKYNYMYSGQFLRAYFNSDYTNSHYYSNLRYTSTNKFNSYESQNSDGCIIGYGMTSNDESINYATILLTPNNYRKVHLTSSNYNNRISFAIGGSSWLNTSSVITTMLISSGINPVTGSIKIYKWVNV